jgi:agmatine deiminase
MRMPSRGAAGSMARGDAKEASMCARIDSTPRGDGYRMPGEFEPHAGTWMLWPQRPDNWRLGGKPAQRAFVTVATAVARFEPLTMGVNHEQFENARNLLPPQVRVVEISNNDAWMRDIGPSFVVDDRRGVRAVDWVFNAWGGQYDGLYFPWDKDDVVPRKVCEIEGIDRYRAPFVLEGGSIHVDGEGTVITTEECLLSPGRNPSMSKEEIEMGLCDYLGVEKVVWLGRGFDPEETTGHVDDVACYVRPGVVAIAWTDDPDDWRHEIMRDNLERLEQATDARGRHFEIARLPCPTDVVITDDEAGGVDAVEGTLPRRPGDRMPATYVNFYICNGGVVMPVFDDLQDETAQATLQGLFPERTVVTVPGREIVLGGGNVHCVTQQQPRA